MMNMKEEMMNDVMDDAMGDEDDEEESEAVVNKVLDELGLEMGGEMSSIPGIGAEEPGIADKNAPQVKIFFWKINFEKIFKINFSLLLKVVVMISTLTLKHVLIIYADKPYLLTL